MDLNADNVTSVQSEVVDSKVCEQVQILKNEADWAEKQQLESEKEIIDLKNVIDQLTVELQRTRIEINTKDFQEKKLRDFVDDKDNKIKELNAEIKKISNESYNYKTKLCVMSSKHNILEVELCNVSEEKNKAEQYIKLLNEEIELLKCQNSKNLLEMQEYVKAAEAKHQSLGAETAEDIKKLSAELTAKSQQVELLQKSLEDQKEDFHARLASIEEREKQINEVWEQHQSQAKLSSLSSKQLSNLEDEITRLHAANKELRMKLSQKFSGLPALLLTQDTKPICSQHVRETLKSFEETNEELRKQLVLAHSKVLKLEKELLECGLRPAKRTFLQPTLSSQNKQRVPLTPACSGKENANKLNSSNTALLYKTVPLSLMQNASTSTATSECFPSGAMSAKK